MTKKPPIFKLYYNSITLLIFEINFDIIILYSMCIHKTYISVIHI